MRGGVNTNKISILFDGNYSPRETLYFNNFTKYTQKKLEDIGNSLIPLFNKKLNTELKLGYSNFRVMILRYEGPESSFGFHYDTEHPDCFRALILYHRKSKIPNFCYIDEKGKMKKIDFKINEGIIFRGTTTFHGVLPSGDNNCERYLIGFQYIKKNTTEKEKPSFCNMLRDKNIIEYIKIFIPYVFYYNILAKLQKISIFNVVDYKTQLFISSCLIYIAMKYSTSISSGTHTPNTIKSVITFYIFCLTMTGDIFLSLNLVSYILSTEMIVTPI